MNSVKIKAIILVTAFMIIMCPELVLLNNELEAQNDRGIKFELSFPAETHNKPITGRAYVIISRKNNPELRFQVGATGVPLWGKNINALRPGETVTFDKTVFGYPLKSVEDIPAGDYFVQGFINIYTQFKRSDGHTLWLHQDQWEGQKWNRSPSNLYSDIKKIHIHSHPQDPVEISVNNTIPPIKVPEDTKWVKRVKIQSTILTEFWGHPQYLGATILLPEGYDENPDVYYPANYIQGHFSLRPPYGFTTTEPAEENRRGMSGYEFYKYWTSDECPRMFAITFQHPCPYYDDSYSVNSANCGPYGDALTKELIPYLEEKFRIIAKPYARILSGGSTGGWASFGMQVFYPDFFGGTFSLCPDPLDFRYYQIVNIYDDKNAYYREYEWMKVERPNNRATDGNIRFMMKDENHYELVIGDKLRSGGQWAIWEAVFGPVGPDGYPKPIWDKMTGEIDNEVAQYWKEHYDLRYYLEKNWSWIGPKLAGKLHVYCGDMDTYYLNNGVKMMENFLESTKNPYYAGTVEYGDGEPHCWGPRGKDIIQLMAEQVKKNAPAGENTERWNY